MINSWYGLTYGYFLLRNYHCSILPSDGDGSMTGASDSLEGIFFRTAAVRNEYLAKRLGIAESHTNLVETSFRREDGEISNRFDSTPV